MAVWIRLVLSSAEADRDVVLDFYPRFLDRLAETLGSDFWITRLQQGELKERVIAGFVGSLLGRKTEDKPEDK